MQHLQTFSAERDAGEYTDIYETGRIDSRSCDSGGANSDSVFTFVNSCQLLLARTDLLTPKNASRQQCRAEKNSIGRSFRQSGIKRTARDELSGIYAAGS